MIHQHAPSGVSQHIHSTHCKGHSHCTLHEHRASTRPLNWKRQALLRLPLVCLIMVVSGAVRLGLQHLHGTNLKEHSSSLHEHSASTCDATCKCTKSVERFWFYDSRLHVSYWWSLGLCASVYSTFLKGHSAGLQEQSLSTSHIAAAQRVPSAFALLVVPHLAALPARI